MLNAIINQITKLGEKVINFVYAFIKNIGESFLLLINFILRKPELSKTLNIGLLQLYHLGFKSLLIICLSALFIGVVIAIQGYQLLTIFNSSSALGSMVSVAIVRELAPVVSALLYAGRSGSALTAEIALMKSTEQLSSLDMMSINSIHRVIGPRFWASFFSLPLLNFIFIAVSIYGGVLVGITWKGIDSGSFYSNIAATVGLTDLLNSTLKSFIFSFFIAWIAVYRGYSSMPTASGISKATTLTVVQSSISILLIDLLLTIYLYGS